MSETSSYREIMRSSSIMGGARAIHYVVRLARVKVVAVVLGPAGVGIIGLYTSATGVVGTVTEMGLRGSSVRSIAEANGHDDPEQLARATRLLQRLCWITGILGWAVSAALAMPLSRWIFQSTTHAWAFAILGGMLFMNAITGGRMGLLQGLRRIGDIARVQVAAAVVNTALAIGLYLWLGQRGIVPVLVLSAAVMLGLSWWFTRRVEVDRAPLDWKATLTESWPLLALGAALMWSTLGTMLVDLFTRTLITRQLGVDAAGIYQAAWALSATFAGFVLTAMGADFYPRLTATIDDHAAARRQVNEQTEIGILLTLPGLLGVLALAPWIVWALYSPAFMAAAGVLVWMVLGMFGRVISWPLGFIQLAAGAARAYAITEGVFLGLQLALVFWLVPRFGVVGAAYAFAITYAFYTAGMLGVGAHLIGFRWSKAVWRMVLTSAALVVAAFAATFLLPMPWSPLAGMTLAVAAGLGCLRGLAWRLGTTHRLVRTLAHVPGMPRFLGLRGATP